MLASTVRHQVYHHPSTPYDQLNTCSGIDRDGWRARVRSLHTYPTLAAAVAEFENALMEGGFLARSGGAQGSFAYLLPGSNKAHFRKLRPCCGSLCSNWLATWPALAKPHGQLACQ